MSPLSNIFTANRVAAIATWLAGLAAFITGIAGTFPEKWQGAAIAIAGILTKLVTTLHFMWGAQKSEALAAAAPAVPVPAILDRPEGEYDPATAGEGYEPVGDPVDDPNV